MGIHAFRKIKLGKGTEKATMKVGLIFCRGCLWKSVCPESMTFGFGEGQPYGNLREEHSRQVRTSWQVLTSCENKKVNSMEAV
jgi:hypothetical protein